MVAKSLEPLDVLVTEKATGGQRADDRGADLMAAVWARADDVADAVVNLRGDPLGGAMPAVLLCEARQVAARARIVADRPARTRLEADLAGADGLAAVGARAAEPVLLADLFGSPDRVVAVEALQPVVAGDDARRR